MAKALRALTKEEASHVGMQTVRFTCKHGDTHNVHGHSSDPRHRHEIHRLRTVLASGCPALKLKPGRVHRPKMVRGRIADPTARLGVPCGAPMTIEVINHKTPERVEPPAEDDEKGETAPDEETPAAS